MTESNKIDAPGDDVLAACDGIVDVVQITGWCAVQLSERTKKGWVAKSFFWGMGLVEQRQVPRPWAEEDAAALRRDPNYERPSYSRHDHVPVYGNVLFALIALTDGSALAAAAAQVESLTADEYKKRYGESVYAEMCAAAEEIPF